MNGESDDGDGERLSPDDAFAAIGHETRIRILEALAETDRADRPLSFSALRDRVGTIDSSQFNYHLGKLVGHFLERTDDGYDLRPAGSRVAEAILSGAVTDDPVLERTRIDHACYHCGAPVEMSYRDEHVELYCGECDGNYGKSRAQREANDVPPEYGFLGKMGLPPAAIQDRTPTEIHDVAHAWRLSEELLTASGTCPRCQATLDEWVRLCEDHRPVDGTCGECDSRYAAQHRAACTNCVFGRSLVFGVALLSNTDLQAFLTAHDVNLVTPDYGRYASVMMDYEEEILGTDPFEAAFTFTADGDAITLTVDDGLDVVEVTTREAD